MLRLKVEHGGSVRAVASGEHEATLVYVPEYVLGDRLIVESDQNNIYLLLQLDDGIAPTFVYLTGNRYELHIPFGESRESYSPRAFAGERHVLSVRLATEDEIGLRKNLALNPWDTHENKTLYPHVTANVETRGESVFAARNAIDGIKAGNGHGPWPFQSWGINQNPKAELIVYFGRDVIIDEVAFYLRADFPHDAWWEEATLDFSDGSSQSIHLTKTESRQSFLLSPRTVCWVRLHSLIKADDPSPFPALTQIELLGTEK